MAMRLVRNAKLILLNVALWSLSTEGFCAGSAKDLLEVDGKPLSIGLKHEFDPSTCKAIVSQAQAERATRTELRINCKRQNELLKLKGFPYCARDLCFASSRTAQYRKFEVVASIWSATAFSNSPGFAVALTIFYDADNQAIIDCIDVSSPSFQLEEMAAFQAYQDYIDMALKCADLEKK